MDLDEKYILQIELDVNLKFPNDFKNRMMIQNGGKIESKVFFFQIHPFFDKSSKKRISRTYNHVGLETKNARQWSGFPKNGIVIGAGGSGDLILFIILPQHQKRTRVLFPKKNHTQIRYT